MIEESKKQPLVTLFIHSTPDNGFAGIYLLVWLLGKLS